MLNTMFSNLKNRQTQFVENETDKTIVLDKLLMNQTVYIQKCKGCTIDITSAKFTKIIIESCSNTKIAIESKLITSTAEIINCDNCEIFFKTSSIRTISCDDSNHCNFKFTAEGNALPPIQLIATESSKNCTIEAPERTGEGIKKHELKHQVPDAHKDAGAKQFRHTFHPEEDKIISDFLIREGSGYVTSEEEKKRNDQRLEKMNEKMEQMITECIRLTKKPEEQ